MFTKTVAKLSFAALLGMSGTLVSNEAMAQPGTIPEIRLTSDQAQISVSSGGCQDMELYAPEFAGNYYLILGSVTGTGLGCHIGGFHIPLAWDAYTAFTLFRPNAGLIQNQMAQLNADGRAGATLCLHDAVAPELVGMQITHCAVVFDDMGNVLGVSNTVSAVLVD